MTELITHIFIISSLIIISVIYFATFVGIIGKGNTERFPYLGVLSVFLAYLMFILIKGYSGDEVGTIVWMVLSILPALAIIVSLFIGRKGNILVDLISLTTTLGLGIVPLLSTDVHGIDTDLTKFILVPSDYSLIVAFASLLVMLSLSTVTFSVLRKRYSSYSTIDRELLNKISEINRQQSIYNAFSSPISKMLSEEMHAEMNQIKGELKSEIARSFYRGQNGAKISRKGGNDIMVEIQKINAMIKNLQMPQRMFTIDDFMKDVKHSLATPLSQIEINCSLLEDLQDPQERYECINKIRSITKVCQNIITSYQEIVTAPSLDDSQPLPDSIDELLTTIEKKIRRKKLVFVKSNIPDNLQGYSVSVLTAMLLPLIQNAIVAAPAESCIEISYKEDENHVLMIKNTCEKSVPTKEQLNTPHYSSKNNHLGVGLSTVRNYLRLLKGGLDYDIDGNIVVAKVTLKKR